MSQLGQSMTKHLQSEWPVSFGKSTDHIGAMSCHYIVHGVHGSNDASAPRSRSVAGKPANNVTGLLVVERLRMALAL